MSKTELLFSGNLESRGGRRVPQTTILHKTTSAFRGYKRGDTKRLGEGEVNFNFAVNEEVSRKAPQKQ